MLNKIQMIQALEKNILGKFSYFQKQLDGMEVIDQGSLLIINSNEVTDMFNIVCCHGNINREQVDDVIQYFNDKELPFAWWIGFEDEPKDLTQMLKRNGLKQSEEELAMAIKLEPSINYDILTT